MHSAYLSCVVVLLTLFLTLPAHADSLKAEGVPVAAGGSSAAKDKRPPKVIFIWGQAFPRFQSSAIPGDLQVSVQHGARIARGSNYRHWHRKRTMIPKMTIDGSYQGRAVTYVLENAVITAYTRKDSKETMTISYQKLTYIPVNKK